MASHSSSAPYADGLIEVNGYLQDIVLGLVILGALYLDRFRRGRA